MDPRLMSADEDTQQLFNSINQAKQEIDKAKADYDKVNAEIQAKMSGYNSRMPKNPNEPIPQDLDDAIKNDAAQLRNASDRLTDIILRNEARVAEEMRDFRIRMKDRYKKNSTYVNDEEFELILKHLLFYAPENHNMLRQNLIAIIQAQPTNTADKKTVMEFWASLSAKPASFTQSRLEMIYNKIKIKEPKVKIVPPREHVKAGASLRSRALKQTHKAGSSAKVKIGKVKHSASGSMRNVAHTVQSRAGHSARTMKEKVVKKPIESEKIESEKRESSLIENQLSAKTDYGIFSNQLNQLMENIQFFTNELEKIGKFKLDEYFNPNEPNEHPYFNKPEIELMLEKKNQLEKGVELFLNTLSKQTLLFESAIKNYYETNFGDRSLSKEQKQKEMELLLRHLIYYMPERENIKLNLRYILNSDAIDPKIKQELGQLMTILEKKPEGLPSYIRPAYTSLQNYNKVGYKVAQGKDRLHAAATDVYHFAKKQKKHAAKKMFHLFSKKSSLSDDKKENVRSTPGLNKKK